MNEQIKDKKFIPVAEPYFTGKEQKYVKQAIDSGWVSSKGEFIGRFEKEFAKYCGVKYAGTCSNGTAALHLALVATGIKPGDEVIIPNVTFISTANAVAFCNAKPVFADICKDTWCIDPEKIEEKISAKTKAIIPVHLYGHPADMKPIMEIAEKHNLFVLEDAAEAIGSEYHGKKAGACGNAGIFSFYGNKTITTGEGGMITSNDEKLMDKINFLKDHAMSKEKRYWHTEIGFNYRLTNMQAAFGLAQLESIEEIIRKKITIAKTYSKLLADTNGIALPAERKGCKNSFWAYTILLEKEFGISRDELAKKLLANGIDTRPFFYPITKMPPYFSNEKFPVSEKVSGKGITLPSATGLKKEEIEYVVSKFK